MGGTIVGVMAIPTKDSITLLYPLVRYKVYESKILPFAFHLSTRVNFLPSLLQTHYHIKVVDFQA